MRKLALAALLASVVGIAFEDLLLLPVLGSPARAAGSAAFLFWGFWRLQRRSMRAPRLAHYIAFGFLFWIVLSFYWSIEPSRSAETIITYAQLVGLVFILWDFDLRQHEINWILQAYIIGSCVTLGILFVNFRAGVHDTGVRFTSTGQDPNFMAVMLALGIPFALHLALHGRYGVMRSLNFVYIPAAFIGIALSGSRAGGIAAAIALIFLIAAAWRLGSIAAASTLAMIVASIGLILIVVPDATLGRVLSTRSEVSGGDLNGRTGLWHESIDALADRPLVGSGVGTTRSVLPSEKSSHNIALTISVELGLVGLLLFATLVALAIISALAHSSDTRLMWLSVLLMWLVSAGTLSLDRTKVTWLILGLVVASAALHAADRTFRSRQGPSTSGRSVGAHGRVIGDSSAL